MTVLPKAINFLACTLKISGFTETASGFNPKILWLEPVGFWFQASRRLA